MLAKAAQQTHIITEGTAASHGRRIKREILFFIKFPQLCTVYMSLHLCSFAHSFVSTVNVYNPEYFLCLRFGTQLFRRVS